jgi:hypothetical protein
MSKEEKILKWYQSELDRDNVQLQKDKNEFINSIKKIDKEKIFETELKKITLWQRIKKVLTGI